MTWVSATVRGAIGILTIERPEKLHVLNLDMINTLLDRLRAFAADDAIHAVVIQAQKAKAFCAGGDVIWLYEHRHEPRLQRQFFEQEYTLNRLIGSYPKPYIALLDGMTIGGGVGISLHGSHRVASTAFCFSMPETAIGFFPDIGASHLLANMKDCLGLYLGLTGARIEADIAHCAGIVDVVVESADFPAILDELTRANLEQAPFEKVSAILSQYQLDVSSEAYDDLCKKTRMYFGKGGIEEIITALGEHHEQEMQAALLSKSPLALKVTQAQFMKARGQTLQACLAMDAILVAHFMKGHDFYEGVRALLVDKDKSPQWQPKSLEAVTREMVLSYFVPDTSWDG